MTLCPLLQALEPPKLPISQTCTDSPYLACIMASQKLGYLKHLWFYIFNPCNNESRHNGGPRCTDFTLRKSDNITNRSRD